MKRLENTYRVVLAHRDRYLVRNEEKELFCVLAGSLRYQEEFPVVGDYVEITENPYGDSLIRSIRERRTVFFRPDRGGHADGFVKTMQVQPLIANMDYVFIITSLNQDFSVNRIARYAAMTVSGGAVPVAALTKADLCPNVAEMEEKAAALSKDLRVVSISSRTGYGMEKIKEFFQPGVTIALLGSSGAGKSTLINTLAGREIMRTGGIREEDAKGRHTTTHRELIDLDGVSLIDTPGLRELGVIDADEERSYPALFGCKNNERSSFIVGEVYATWTVRMFQLCVPAVYVIFPNHRISPISRIADVTTFAIYNPAFAVHPHSKYFVAMAILHHAFHL